MADLRETLEREVKLRAGPDFELPELGGEAIEPRVFDSTYHDTRDHRLARHGVTLRHRIENRKGLWQLKLPQGGRTPRARGARARRRLLPRRSCRSARVPARRAAAAARPAAHEANRRARAGGRDRLRRGDRDRRARTARSFEELEVELLEGDEKALRRLEKALRRAGAADGETRPKVLQALDLTFEPDVTAAGAAAARRRRRSRPQLKSQYERLLAHDPGTRLGADNEELHQFRVATRRLRAFLRAGRELLDPAWGEPLRDGARWLGGELGPSRDLDVLIDRLRREVETLGEDARGRPRARRAARAGSRRASAAGARRALERPLLRDPRPSRAAAAAAARPT